MMTAGAITARTTIATTTAEIAASMVAEFPPATYRRLASAGSGYRIGPPVSSRPRPVATGLTGTQAVGAGASSPVTAAATDAAMAMPMEAEVCFPPVADLGCDLIIPRFWHQMTGRPPESRPTLTVLVPTFVV